MMAIRTILRGSLLALAALAAPLTASAQTGTNLVKPASLAASNGTSATGASNVNRWTCTFKTVEIAPVSFDTSGGATGWVIVYRMKGEVIASERISARKAQQLRALPCADELDGVSPLVG